MMCLESRRAAPRLLEAAVSGDRDALSELAYWFRNRLGGEALRHTSRISRPWAVRAQITSMSMTITVIAQSG
jgi:hypothetical protein